MNLNHARQQFADITSKFGIKKVLGCGCLGCMLPFLSALVFIVVVGWWLFATPVHTQVQSTAYHSRYNSPTYTEQGQPLRPGVPTPIYAPDNAQGAIRHPELPSMMGNQPGYLVEGQADYKHYEGGNSLANKSWYLAQANFTGASRTPYVRGQQLSNGMTVITADFDFVLLQDSVGVQWFCDPTGVRCQWWR